MKKIFSRIENFLVLFSRVFWVVISLLSFVAALIFLLIGLNKYFLVGQSAGLVETPEWTQIKTIILPPKLDQASEDKVGKEDNNFNSNIDVLFNLPEKELRQVLDSIYINFNDDEKNLKKIKSELTPKSLDSYLFFKWMKKYDRTDYNIILVGLSDLFNSAYSTKDLLKIGSYDNRLIFIYSSLDAYYLNLDQNIELYQIKQFEIEQNKILRKGEGLIYLMIAGSSISAFIFLVLFIVIFRVENHLRKISNEN